MEVRILEGSEAAALAASINETFRKLKAALIAEGNARSVVRGGEADG